MLIRSKKFIIIFIFIVVSIYCFSITKPSKKKNAGAIIGKIELYFTNSWLEIDQGKSFNNVTLKLKNKFLNKKYFAYGDRNGLFCFLNLPEGYYVLTGCDFYDMESAFYYKIDDINFGEKGIIVSVHSNTISVLKTINIKLEPASNNRVNIQLERIDETERIKNLFKKKIFMITG